MDLIIDLFCILMNIFLNFILWSTDNFKYSCSIVNGYAYHIKSKKVVYRKFVISIQYITIKSIATSRYYLCLYLRCIVFLYSIEDNFVLNCYCSVKILQFSCNRSYKNYHKTCTRIVYTVHICKTGFVLLININSCLHFLFNCMCQFEITDEWMTNMR